MASAQSRRHVRSVNAAVELSQLVGITPSLRQLTGRQYGMLYIYINLKFTQYSVTDRLKEETEIYTTDYMQMQFSHFLAQYSLFI